MKGKTQVRPALKKHKFFIPVGTILLALVLAASCSEHPKATPTGTNLSQDALIQSFSDSVPKAIGYVNDYEGLYTGAERKRLDSLIRSFERRTRIQIAILTIDMSLTSADRFDAFTLRVANAWGVGQKDLNNGLTIGISKAYRKMRIRNGDGIARVLSDAETEAIIQRSFIPRFREGKYFEGTWEGLKAITDILGQRYTQIK